jgi:tetratricopeptide (TPR) repeat protein
MAAVCVRSTTAHHIDDRPAPEIEIGLAIACVALLLLSMIDIVLSENAGLMLLATCAGAVSGRRWPAHVAAFGVRIWPAVAGLSILATTSLIWAAALNVPVALAEQSAHRATANLAARDRRFAADGFAAAYDRAPLANTDYAIRAAATYLAAGERVLAGRWFDRAVDADAFNAAPYLQRARYRLVAPGGAESVREAFDDFAVATRLNPQDIETRLEFAERLADAGRNDEAVEQFAAAIDIHTSYDPGEPERLSERRIAAIRQRIESLRGR